MKAFEIPLACIVMFPSIIARPKKPIVALVLGFSILLGASNFCGAQVRRGPKPVVIQDTYANDWMHWDAKDVFLALPEIVSGMNLRKRAENLSRVKGNRVTGMIAVNGVKIGFRIVTRTEKHLLVFVTVVTGEKRENWRLVREVGQWSVTPN